MLGLMCCVPVTMAAQFATARFMSNTGCIYLTRRDRKLQSSR